MTTVEQGAPASAPPKSLFERVVETLGTGLGSGIGWLADHGVLFAIFLFIWLAFGAALVANPAAVDSFWIEFGGMNIVVQLLLWLLFLPVMAGLWIWEASGWDVLIRVALVGALAAWTLLVFKPKSWRLARREPRASPGS